MSKDIFELQAKILDLFGIQSNAQKSATKMLLALSAQELPQLHVVYDLWSADENSYSELKEMFEVVPLGQRITPMEKGLILMLIEFARLTFTALDDSEEKADGTVLIGPTDSALLISALKQLDELPNDKPDYVLGPSQKVGWALRAILGESYEPFTFREPSNESNG